MKTAKALAVRLEPKVYARLRLQADAENCSMNDVVRDALHAYFEIRRIPRQRLLEMAAEIVAEDAELLEALDHL